MYVSVNPQKSFNSYGSSHDLVMYLEKENEGLETEKKEHFFNQYKDDISPYKVINGIDNNVKGLKENEAKFYTLLLSPNQKELEHIKNNKEYLKSYTQDVMNAYATHFNRTIDGRPLEGGDLVWFAKVEDQRTYSRFDKDVQHNEQLGKSGNYKRTPSGTIIKEGVKKEGMQSHIHVIVSRRDASQKLSLSPSANAKKADVKITRYMYQDKIIPKTKAMQMVLGDLNIEVKKDPVSKKMVFKKDGHSFPKNKAQQLFETNSALMGKKGITKVVQTSRIGFERDMFFQKAEDIFDYKFSYQRKLINSYQYKNYYKNKINKLPELVGQHMKARLKSQALTLGGNVTNITKPVNALNALTKIPVDPVSLGIKVAKKAVTKVIQAGLTI